MRKVNRKKLLKYSALVFLGSLVLMPFFGFFSVVLLLGSFVMLVKGVASFLITSDDYVEFKNEAGDDWMDVEIVSNDIERVYGSAASCFSCSPDINFDSVYRDDDD